MISMLVMIVKGKERNLGVYAVNKRTNKIERYNALESSTMLFCNTQMRTRGEMFYTQAADSNERPRGEGHPCTSTPQLFL